MIWKMCISAACLGVGLWVGVGPRRQDERKHSKMPLVLEVQPVHVGPQKVHGRVRVEVQPLTRARAAHPAYRVGEPVVLRLRLRNVGHRNVFVNRGFRLNDQVWLQVVGPGGREEGWCGILPEWANPPGTWVFLAPGAHVQGYIRASCDKTKKVTWGYKFPGPGTYTITATYELPWPLSELKKAAGSALVVKGPVVSRPVRVTVLPK